MHKSAETAFSSRLSYSAYEDDINTDSQMTSRGILPALKTYGIAINSVRQGRQGFVCRCWTSWCNWIAEPDMNNALVRWAFWLIHRQKHRRQLEKIADNSKFSWEHSQEQTIDLIKPRRNSSGTETYDCVLGDQKRPTLDSTIQLRIITRKRIPWFSLSVLR